MEIKEDRDNGKNKHEKCGRNKDLGFNVQKPKKNIKQLQEKPRTSATFVWSDRS